MDSAIRVPGLVGNDLPLGASLDNNVGSGNRLSAASRVLLRAISAGLAKPCQSNGRACVARAEKGPMRVLVALLATPLGELVETVLDGDAAAAGLVPRGRLLLRGRAVGFGDDKIGEAEGNVERALEELRGLVDLVDDVLLRLVLVPVEGLHVGAVSGDAHERNLAGAGTALGAANGRDEVDAGAVARAAGLSVELALAEEA